MKFKSIILSIILSLFVILPANLLHADDAVTKILGKAQELAEKQKIKGKILSKFITNNVIIVDYEGEVRAYKFNTDVTYEVYVGGKIVEQGTWSIKGLTKSSIKLTGHQDLYIQIYKDKERISTLTNLKKKNDSQTNRKIIKISSSSDFEKQLAQIELEKQKALEQKKREEEEKRLAELKAAEEKKRQEEEEKRIAEEKKRQEEEDKRIAEEEKKRQEEEEKRIAEEEKKQAEIQKIASSKLKKLDDYSKSNEQLLKKAREISKKLYEFKDSKEINSEEGTNLINKYNLAFEDQYSQAIAEAAEVPYVETPVVETIHLPLKTYVANGERKIKKYQAALEKAEKKEKAEREKQKRLEEKAEKKRIAEEEREKKDELDKLLKETRERTAKALEKVEEAKKKEDDDKFSEFESQSQRSYLKCQYIMPKDVIYREFAYDGKSFFLDGVLTPMGKDSDNMGFEAEISQKGKKPIFLVEGTQYLDPEKTMPMYTMEVYVDFTKQSSSVTMTTIATGRQTFRGQCYVP